MIAQKLKALMNERGMTQTELSLKTGIPKSGISQYLSGVHKPGMKALSALAKALDVTEEDLDDERKIKYSVTGIRNVPVKVAAEIMGKSQQYVRESLIKGTLPIGNANKVKSKYSFYISPKLLFEMTGVDVNADERKGA